MFASIGGFGGGNFREGTSSRNQSGRHASQFLGVHLWYLSMYLCMKLAVFFFNYFQVYLWYLSMYEIGKLVLDFSGIVLCI
jgi:hypothetical protein